MPASTDEVLTRASRGEASFAELARALAEIEQLTILLRPRVPAFAAED